MVPQWLVSAGNRLPRGSRSPHPALWRRALGCLSGAALVLAAAITVRLSGSVEAYFLFFLAVPVIALFEDWLAMAVATVVVAGSPALLQLAFAGASGSLPPANSALLGTAFLLEGVLCLIPAFILAGTRTAELEKLGALESQALHDPLTGLANRSLLAARLREAMAASRITGVPLLVLSVDIDGFKPINDSYGHGAGDALLVEIARRLRFCLRTGDTAARTGGDEFTLLLPGSGLDQGAATALRVMDAVAAPVQLAGTELRMSASVGITAGSGMDGPEQLLAEADTAMYAAKHSGRSRFVIYDATQRQDTRGALEISPSDARCWAAYTVRLRLQIASAKDLGLLPEQTRGPETARRTLETLLAAIGQLPDPEQPDGEQRTKLPLPQARALAEFVFHHQLVQQWADSLVSQGILTASRPADAERFWSDLRDAVTVADNPGPRSGSASRNTLDTNFAADGALQAGTGKGPVALPPRSRG